ncbi:uncharacterized protein LOC127529621 [Erpetoichthys calabaricus]|uniref:uncharacterized protein LOC127529621 n=1 Tax=Erpetoichthys calabaricus TaxID=27687 RepID=UPI0022347CC0|nr:uncharacterized protein LOC127529621 [Erpetoichthys calabaricus]
MMSFSTEDVSPQEKPQVLLNCNREKELPKCLKLKECPNNKYITLFCTYYQTINTGVPVLLTTALSIGPILLLAGIVLLVLWLRRRRKQKQPENTDKRFSIQNGSLSDYEDIEDGFPDELPMVRQGLENQPDLTQKEKLEKSSLSANGSYLLFDTDGEMEKRVEQKDTAKGSQEYIAMNETAFDQETQLDEDGDNQMSLELQLQDDYDDVDCINISEQNRSSPQLIDGNEEGEQ